MQRLLIATAVTLLASCAGSPRGSETTPEPRSLDAATTGADEPADDQADVAVAPESDDGDADRPLRLTVLNSGQGDCALLECPNGANVMIDCGSTAAAGSSHQAVAARLDQLIGAQGRIDVLVITHPDQDHYNWIERVVRDHHIERAIHSRSLSEYSVRGFNMWLSQHAAEIVALDGEVHDAARSELFDCGDVDVRILSANAPALSHPNDRGWISNGASIVLRVHREVNGASFTAILTGDATFDTEDGMLAAYASMPEMLDCDVLRIGHHGSDVTSTSDRWLAATTPRVAFSSSGHHGSFRHPRCMVSDRVSAAASLDDTSCHQLVCGAGPNDQCAGGFCTRSVARAVYDTFSAGELSIEFDGELRVTAERAGAAGCH